MPATHLLSKEKLLQSETLLIFLLNCLKSSWALVRVHAYDILMNLPNDHPLLNDNDFVNKVMLGTALDFCNSPKAMMAEGGALLLKLLFQKCLSRVHFVKASEDTKDMQLQYLEHVLSLIEQRLSTFTQTLIKEGKTTSLLHGLLGFFKSVFVDFKVNSGDFDGEVGAN